MLGFFLGFGVGEFDRMEGVAFFGELERFDDFFGFEVLEESKHEFTSAQFCLIISVFDTAILEDIRKCDC